MFERIRRVVVVVSSLLASGIAMVPGIAMAAEMRLENPPVKAVTEGTVNIPVSFPDAKASSSGALRIGQTFAEVRASLLAANPATRIFVQNRRFYLRDMRTEPNVVIMQAEIRAPDHSYVERWRLRFTSKMTGQRLYFIHRDIEFRKASRATQRDFGEQMAARYTGSTWAIMTPGFFSFRQIYTDGRMLTWGESQRRPELGGCFMLSGGAGLDALLDDGGLGHEMLVDVAPCGGGVDADWRGDIGRFTVTLIDFPLFREDRELLRRTLEVAARRIPNTESRVAP